MWVGENVGTYTKTNLKKYAADLQLDTAKFNECLDTERTKSVIDNDRNDVIRLRVNGTPAFFLNDRPLQVTSVLDASEFSRAFDLFLK